MLALNGLNGLRETDTSRPVRLLKSTRGRATGDHCHVLIEVGA